MDILWDLSFTIGFSEYNNTLDTKLLATENYMNSNISAKLHIVQKLIQAPFFND